MNIKQALSKKVRIFLRPVCYVSFSYKLFLILTLTLISWSCDSKGSRWVCFCLSNCLSK